MDKRLFVGNLPFSMTSDSLRAIFTPFGEIVSAEVVINKLTNRSKGFGFVEYSTNPEALAAIDALNDTEQEGRKIIVAFAKPRPDQAAPEQSAPVDAPVAVDTSPVVEDTVETSHVEEVSADSSTVETEPVAEASTDPVLPEITETNPVNEAVPSENSEPATDKEA